jgi:hypothetical protein
MEWYFRRMLEERRRLLVAEVRWYRERAEALRQQ